MMPQVTGPQLGIHLPLSVEVGAGDVRGRGRRGGWEVSQGSLWFFTYLEGGEEDRDTGENALDTRDSVHTYAPRTYKHMLCGASFIRTESEVDV